VRISPEWLRRAFDILIDNAIEAASKSTLKRVTVGLRREDPWLIIAVRDTGCGIAEDLRSRLLEKPIEKSRGERGLGMGLLMARTIIQAYRGDVEVESTDPGGTTMIIRLPLEA